MKSRGKHSNAFVLDCTMVLINMAKQRILVCPVCGETQEETSICRLCKNALDADGLLCAEGSIGPWWVRDKKHPFAPGMTYDHLVALVNTGEVERHTIACIVDDESGALARVVGLFSGRGYNIESLTVAVVDPERDLSRITLVTTGTQMVIEQIKSQLGRLVPIHRVIDLTDEGPHVERELALLKISGTGEKRVEALRIADIFRARAVDSTSESFVFELTGTTEKVDAFIELMEPLGLIEIARTGVVGIARGATAYGIENKD